MNSLPGIEEPSQITNDLDHNNNFHPMLAIFISLSEKILKLIMISVCSLLRSQHLSVRFHFLSCFFIFICRLVSCRSIDVLFQERIMWICNQHVMLVEDLNASSIWVPFYSVYTEFLIFLIVNVQVLTEWNVTDRCSST